MNALDKLIAECEALLVRYRSTGLPFDALAAPIRLKALMDARDAVQGRT